MYSRIWMKSLTPSYVGWRFLLFDVHTDLKGKRLKTSWYVMFLSCFNIIIHGAHWVRVHRCENVPCQILL